MSRIRYIKPGFFENEQLAECTPLARILFAGLWCWADREGRLEERPKRLKAQILPYDDCDIISLLAELQQQGFIRRYEVDGERYLLIPQFASHQKPHRHEPTSSLPNPRDGVTSTAIVGRETDIVRSDHDEPREPKPHGEWGMGNGEWVMGTENGGASELDHPLWGNGAPRNDDDPDNIVFDKVDAILECVGRPNQEVGITNILAKYTDDPDPVEGARDWLVKYGGKYDDPGTRVVSYGRWMEIRRSERKSGRTGSNGRSHVRVVKKDGIDADMQARFQAISDANLAKLRAQRIGGPSAAAQ